MRERKRRMEFYSFYDHVGIAAHLEKMAGKGWLLQKITRLGWIYERTEPKKLKFAVSYYAKASELDPEPSEEQQIFHDFCAHTGWKLICTFGQLQIFCNEEENPVPIETDPVLEVENIHKAAKKGILLGYVFLIIQALCQEYRVVPLMWREPVRFLSNANMIYFFMVFIIFLLMGCVGLGRYFCWYFRAKKAAEQGRALQVRGHFLWRAARYMMWFVIVLLTLCWLAFFIRTGTKREHWICIVMTVYVIVLFTLEFLLLAYLKRIGMPKNMNMAVTVFSVLLVGIVLMWGIGAVAFRRDFGTFEQDVTKHGESCIIHQKEPPLSVEDFSDAVCDKFIYQQASESPLLGQRVVRFFTPEGPTELHYSFTLVKAPFLYDWCKEQLLQSPPDCEDPGSAAGAGNLNGVIGAEGSGRKYVQEDASPWGALEAYRLAEQELGEYYHYLLLFEDRMVQIGFRGEPAPGQKAIVGEKLAGR